MSVLTIVNKNNTYFIPKATISQKKMTCYLNLHIKQSKFLKIKLPFKLYIYVCYNLFTKLCSLSCGLGLGIITSIPDGSFLTTT